ncbi:MAG: transglutaminase-like domain-containing protein [Anaerolineae bacterium]
MYAMTLLSDRGHPAVQAKADELTSDKSTLLDQVESIFGFVRDEIPFGFPPKWDAVKASETLQVEKGYCTSKATLFVAPCRAAGISARVHTGHIDIQNMRGIFPSFAFPFLPSAGGHAWTEIDIDGEWKPIAEVVMPMPDVR